MDLGYIDRMVKIGIVLHQKENIYNCLLARGVKDKQLEREISMLKGMLKIESSFLTTQP
jgi:hypothetical protein